MIIPLGQKFLRAYNMRRGIHTTHFLFTGRNKLPFDRTRERRADRLPRGPALSKFCSAFLPNTIVRMSDCAVSVKSKAERGAVIAGSKLVWRKYKVYIVCSYSSITDSNLLLLPVLPAVPQLYCYYSYPYHNIAVYTICITAEPSHERCPQNMTASAACVANYIFNSVH